MMKSSMPMMGSKLELQQLSPNNTGSNAKLRWFGKVMGFRMDFTVVTTNWVKDSEKIWETVGDARMIILSWYRMRLFLRAVGEATDVELSIDYEKPKTIFFGLLAFLLAPIYANWCLGNMLTDSKMALEVKTSSTIS